MKAELIKIIEIFHYQSNLDLLFILLLLLISWGLGFFAHLSSLARRERIHKYDYFEGINYLLNDEPDEAVDIFIANLEFTANTFDTFLALGRLLRRRGKVDASIAHFEKILKGKTLTKKQRVVLELELSRSYLAGGLFDRAEQQLAEIRPSKIANKLQVLQLSILVYQKEKEWAKAIVEAKELLKLLAVGESQKVQLQLSHFYCELAEIAISQKKLIEASTFLEEAENYLGTNIRVFQLRMQLATLSGDKMAFLASWRLALKLDMDLTLLITAEQSRQYDDLGELFPELREELLKHCTYVQLPQSKVEVTQLLQLMSDKPALPLLKVAIEKLIAVRSSPKNYETNVRDRTSVDFVLESELLRESILLLNTILTDTTQFRCEHCGFELKNIHWCCPGCSSWGLVSPIRCY